MKYSNLIISSLMALLLAGTTTNARADIKASTIDLSMPSLFPDHQKCKRYNKIKGGKLDNLKYLYNNDCSTTYVLPPHGKISVRPSLVNLSACEEMQNDIKNFANAKQDLEDTRQNISKIKLELQGRLSDRQRRIKKENLKAYEDGIKIQKEIEDRFKEHVEYWNGVTGIHAAVIMEHKVNQDTLDQIEKKSKNKFIIRHEEDGAEVAKTYKTYATTANTLNSKWYLTYRAPDQKYSNRQSILFKSFVGESKLFKVSDKHYSQELKYNGDELTGELEMSLAYACDFFKDNQRPTEKEIQDKIGSGFWTVHRTYQVELLGQSGFKAKLNAKPFVQTLINIVKNQGSQTVRNIFNQVYDTLKDREFTITWEDNESGLDDEKLKIFEKEIFKQLSLNIISKINEYNLARSQESVPVNLKICWESANIKGRNSSQIGSASFCNLKSTDDIFPKEIAIDNYYSALQVPPVVELNKHALNSIRRSFGSNFRF